ncbi:MAG: sulfatase-like hydrolase/transferase [Ilumatobacteraceae bacterium]|nr:sulfatase-like hydrolase/transferase [Ilumatobacteraceae bacterium]
MADSRPNVLMFMTDQLRYDALACNGSPVAHTPNFDAVASRGVRCTDAFSQHSVCGPSRVSMLTGWYPHVAGHRTLTNLVKPYEPNLFALLRDAGYHVAWAGERGDMFAPGVADASTDRRGFAITPIVLTEPSPFGPDDPWFAAHYHGRRDGGADGPTLDFDEASVRTAIEWITDGLPEPWCLLIALIFPHPPFVAEEPWFSMHDRATMPAPAPWVPDGKPRFMQALRTRYGTGDFDESRWAEIAATYHGMVSRADDQLGRVLSAVDHAGQGERTMTWCFTDHGEYLGDHGLVEKWPSGQHDVLLRNPLLVAGPGVAEGATCDALIEMVDLLPTLLDVADGEARHTHFGRSLVEVLADPSKDHRTHAFAEGGFLLAEGHLLEQARGAYAPKAAQQHDDPVSVGKAMSVRTHTHSYVHRLYEAPELYDLVDDPYETVNLAGRPEVADVEAALRAELMEWMLATTDVIPWDKDPRFEPTMLELFAR